MVIRNVGILHLYAASQPRRQRSEIYVCLIGSVFSAICFCVLCTITLKMKQKVNRGFEVSTAVSSERYIADDLDQNVDTSSCDYYN
jgi:hypothetical protein